MQKRARIRMVDGVVSNGSLQLSNESSPTHGLAKLVLESNISRIKESLGIPR